MTMARIIRHVEEEALDRLPPSRRTRPDRPPGPLTRAAVGVGNAVEATHIIAFTETGSTARLIAGTARTYRCSPSPRTSRCAANWRSWGVETFRRPR